MEYVVVALALGFGVMLGVTVSIAYVLRVVTRQRPETRDSDGLQFDPNLADSLGRVLRAAALAQAHELPAAAGQDPCGVTSTTDGRLTCDRPLDHEGPHAVHRPGDLVNPVAVWETDW